MYQVVFHNNNVFRNFDWLEAGHLAIYKAWRRVLKKCAKNALKIHFHFSNSNIFEAYSETLTDDLSKSCQKKVRPVGLLCVGQSSVKCNKEIPNFKITLTIHSRRKQQNVPIEKQS